MAYYITASNDDFMKMLWTFKADVLASNKTLSDSRWLLFKSLQDKINKIVVQTKELNAENTLLKGEIDAL